MTQELSEKLVYEAILQGKTLHDLTEEVRKAYLHKAMLLKAGNQCHSAELAGVPRNTLGRLLSVYEIPRATGKA